MRKTALGLLILLSVASVSFAQCAINADTGSVTIQGTLIDNLCLGSAGTDPAGFIKEHTKECALMPPCIASGYSIFADGKTMKFDVASNAKIEEFLRGAGSTLEVKVVAQKAGDLLELVSIENRK